VAESGEFSLHQTFDAFERQHQAKRHADLQQVFLTLRRFGKLARDMPPRSSVAVWRAGRCFSTKSRTSARVVSFIAVGMVRGRGKRRGQFGLGTKRSDTTMDSLPVMAGLRRTPWR